LSYVDRNVEIDPQPKLGANVREMTRNGVETDKQKVFDLVRLKNQFKIVKNPEVVFAIVTSKHSTFTRKDIAKVLNRYIDDADQFQVLLGRLMNSKELIDLESASVHQEIQSLLPTKVGEPVYTTRAMLRVELNLIKTAERLSAQKTHNVLEKVVEGALARHNEKLVKYKGLSIDQQAAIRHMLSPDQISCVVGFAGAGKTTCLEAAREAWEESGYKIVGLAPTGKAARNMEGCGIRSMTIHKFLLAQEHGRERVSTKTILVLDEAGMVDSRRFGELLALVNQTGAKIVAMGDGNQLQSIEAGPAFRLLLDRIKPAALETIVRQQTEWQREATRLFGTLNTRKALESYQANGCFTTVREKTPNWMDQDKLLDHFCLARQMSGRIWKEMQEDFSQEFGKEAAFNPETDFETLTKHQDFPLFQNWKKTRRTIVGRIIDHYDGQEQKLKERGVDIKALGSLVTEYKANLIPNPTNFKKIEAMLRQMSYGHIVDTRESAREAMVNAWGEDWAKDQEATPDRSHLMLTFTNKDANKLNEAAREFMRAHGKITGADHTLETQRIDEDDFGKQVITFHDRTFAKGDRLLFTHNDNSLNVKNGSLGTILEINKQKITVALDDGQKTLSFSPNLYPFIDNGWATTIHKAQGVTVGIVKLLASFEQFRNLAYVGMSRHCHSVKLYASSLDFWREEKIIDRLSRVQEKLSGFDYLDADKIQKALEEDTAILWHEQKVTQAKDFWTAIKVTAQDVFDKVLDRPPEDKGAQEEFLSFEDSEEMRSKDFFETSSNTKSKGAFGREGPLSEGSPSEGSPVEGSGTCKTTSKDQPTASPGSQKTPQEERDGVVQQGSVAQGLATKEPSPQAGDRQSLEKTLSVKSLKKPSVLARKQEKFEKSRLSFHQEWCAQLGFFVQHRRFPNKDKEIAAAWWQGERLTAIEGRLYREALERKEEPDEKQLTLDARVELTKNQKAPSHILALGKASELDKNQLKQFEQHVLIHQDKTGLLPKPSDLGALCQAIKVRSQIMEAEGADNRANNQGETSTKTLGLMPGEKTSEKTSDPASDLYRTLLEQQAVLVQIKGDRQNNLTKNEEVIAALQTCNPQKAHDLKDSCRDFCLERLDRLNAKIQSVKEFSQEMKALDRIHQNQRGIEM
jgi:ATP-dependent exoDNAse (exonuclease V) alpha subunit